MKPLADPAEITPLDRVKDRLDGLIRQTLDESGESHAVRRIELRLEPLDCLLWLQDQGFEQQVFWSNREKDLRVAAVGSADVLTETGPDGRTALYRAVAERIRDAEGKIRYFGGFRFSGPDRVTTGWHDFGDHWFLLPRFELETREDGALLSVHLTSRDRADGGAALFRDLDRLVFAPPHSCALLPAPRSREDHPAFQTWRDMVDGAIGKIENGDLDKVVLARKATLLFDEPLNAYHLINRLRTATPECFHFCLQPRPGVVFVGASPERLFRRIGRSVETEAVAGTRPRGRTPEEDRRFSEELIASGKDLREHLFVRDEIWETMEPLCESLVKDKKVSIRKLALGQHLYTKFQGVLQEDITDADLLESLHPTPAVGGCPTDIAVEHIVRHEGFDRGLYASPVGWFGRDESDFTVAIRSGLIRDTELALFSGAGIVQGSRPEMEWDEVENKIADFIKVLTAV